MPAQDDRIHATGRGPDPDRPVGAGRRDHASVTTVDHIVHNTFVPAERGPHPRFKGRLADNLLRLHGRRDVIGAEPQEQTEFGIAIKLLPGASRDLTRQCNVPLLRGLVALDESERRDSGNGRNRHAKRANDDLRPLPPGRLLPLQASTALDKEPAFPFVESAHVTLAPRGEPGASVQAALIATRGVPLVSGLGQAPVESQRLPVTLDP